MVVSPFTGCKKQKPWNKTCERYMPVRRRQNLAETRQGIACYVPMCLACLRALMPRCLACSRAHLPTFLVCIYAHVSTSQACSRATVPCMPTCSRANVP